MKRILSALSLLGVVGALTMGGSVGPAGAGSPGSPRPATTPIQHVVIVYQENHSFDNVLGWFCAHSATAGCEGATTGKISTGATIPLARPPDVVPQVDHRVNSQQVAMNGGAMDSFDKLAGCSQADHYACYTAYRNNQVPNLATLASTYAINDRTFQMDSVASWGGHIELVAATLDGFTGDNPVKGQVPLGPGWGCDSKRVAPWKDPNTGQVTNQPSCIPDLFGQGPFRPSPVQYVPTIMEELDQAQLSWKLYASRNPPGQPNTQAAPYGWAICPTFFTCLNTQSEHMVDTDQVLTDAAAGQLPAFSVVLPNQSRSQHNSDSMIRGDNWIGQLVAAIQADATDWPSTAILITYDDCGCFYDHVPPPSGLGLRVPLVIVSPYAVQGTDHNVASIASLLAFTEHTFGLPSLNAEDASAYDFSAAFDFGGPPRLAPVRMVQTRVPPSSIRYINAHPPDEDDET
jgi:phospholipase C